MYRVSQLFVYPIKSLGGIQVASADVADRGFQYDRRWMLVDESMKFLTQRVHRQMALLDVTLSAGKVSVKHKVTGDLIEFGLEDNSHKLMNAQVWEDQVEVCGVNENVDQWFSDVLKIKCRLVYMPDKSKRYVDNNYALAEEITSLSDGYPFLIIGQAALDDLNSRLEEKISVSRFRPNIVFEGGNPFDEDNWKEFIINDIKFSPVKPCARCVITTINPETAVKSEEPLLTLSKYRKSNNKILFGQNLLHEGNGILSVGDLLKVHMK
jgi:uncharacterized protein